MRLRARLSSPFMSTALAHLAGALGLLLLLVVACAWSYAGGAP